MMTVPQAMQLALQHHQAGHLAEAEALYRQILAVQPQYADALHLLGVIAHQVGQQQAAIELIDKAIALNPGDAAACSNLGEAYRVLGRMDEAIAAYRRALQLNPNQPEALSNLGNVLRSVGRLEEAIEACRCAIDLRPAYAEAHLNLANALSEQKRLEEAIVAYHRALEINPADAEAWNSYGAALSEVQRFDEAEAAYRRAIESQPNHSGALCNLANILAERGRHEEATAAYRHVLAIKPEDAATHSNLICTLQFHPGVDRAAIVEERRAWDLQFGHPPSQMAGRPENVRNPERRLRIGYVSPDFRDHVVGRNLRPLFHEHDRGNFEILCYSGVIQPDATTAEFQRFADGWRSTIGVGDDALAGMIRQDAVDILVDLTQHMAGNRLTAFARWPAPVQVSFAGYPETTGLSAIPCRISDRYLEENPVESATGERIFRLESFWCYQPGDVQVAIGELPCQRSGRVTFGCLNNFCKLNDQMLQLWAQVLRLVGDSRLILLSAQGSHRQWVMDVFGREGIDAGRVEFVERASRRDYLEYYNRLDIVLDSFPYNGHTTSLDALWMGVPVVSRVGDSPVSRAGLSQLSNLGLTELVARTENEFIDVATKLAGDLSRLAELRATLRPRMEASVLMNAPHFARQIEAAYCTMWRQWCAANPGT